MNFPRKRIKKNEQKIWKWRESSKSDMKKSHFTLLEFTIFLSENKSYRKKNKSKERSFEYTLNRHWDIWYSSDIQLK